jgi:hypothetical protein
MGRGLNGKLTLDDFAKNATRLQQWLELVSLSVTYSSGSLVKEMMGHLNQTSWWLYQAGWPGDIPDRTHSRQLH